MLLSFAFWPFFPTLYLISCNNVFFIHILLQLWCISLCCAIIFGLHLFLTSCNISIHLHTCTSTYTLLCSYSLYVMSSANISVGHLAIFSYSKSSANISVSHFATFSYSISFANIKVEYKNIPEGFTAAELDELAAVGSIKDNNVDSF